MEEKTLNVLLVEDDEVDVMNVKRAFKKNKVLDWVNDFHDIYALV